MEFESVSFEPGEPMKNLYRKIFDKAYNRDIKVLKSPKHIQIDVIRRYAENNLFGEFKDSGSDSTAIDALGVIARISKESFPESNIYEACKEGLDEFVKHTEQMKSVLVPITGEKDKDKFSELEDQIPGIFKKYGKKILDLYEKVVVKVEVPDDGTEHYIR